MSLFIKKTFTYITKGRLIFAWGIYFGLLIISFFAFSSLGYLLEDTQRIVFPFALLLFLFISRSWKIKVPFFYFAAGGIIWVFFCYRIEMMRELGYFDERVVIGRFNGDSRGLEARRLLQNLKVLGITYSLPGPSLIPLDGRLFNFSSLRNKSGFVSDYSSSAKRWFDRRFPPSLMIFGEDGFYNVLMPIVEREKLWGVQKEFLPSKIYGLPVHVFGYSSPFALPQIPGRVSLPRDPESVMEHYIAWLSAFFSETISENDSAKIDVINEAASVGGPWRGETPKALARYLFSYQEMRSTLSACEGYGEVESPNISSCCPEIGDAERSIIEERLMRAISGLKLEPKGELYGYVVTLYALSKLYGGFERFGESHNEAVRLLEKLLKEPSVPLSAKLGALHNLQVLMGD
ncbi:MAG TPA: hypothetical protein PKA63_06385 [Oligoflexia bacterium]|nr:hypothetical protein [Oligoflexia bacterium]HMP48276.1 hypothetical protein [Oligoflexia bacterium]